MIYTKMKLSKRFLYIVILCIIIGMIALIVTNTDEGFTPRIRETYRPLIRSVRMGVEGFYTRWSKYISAKMGRYT
jgi:uncharacterized membrane protein